MNDLIFLFFTTGRDTMDLEETELQRLQSAHLDNFRRLHKAGLLLLAGPCADPERIRRGIVLLRGVGIEELQTHFAPDPYVTGGYLGIEAHVMEPRLLDLGATPAETGISEHVLLLIEDRPGRYGATGQPSPDLSMLERLPWAERPRIFLTRSRANDPLCAVAIFAQSGPPNISIILEENGVPSAAGAGRAPILWKQWLGRDTLLA